MLAAVDGEARRQGAEEVYIAVAPDLAKSRMLRRQEGDGTLGVRFAVRASVAYKGAWVRMTRTLARDGTDDLAATGGQFAAATAMLPDTAALAAFPAWLIEGCRALQPLEPFAGSVIAEAIAIPPGAVVTVSVAIDTPGGPVLIGAPVLTGRNGERASLLISPEFA
jgi:hypothetical protein